MIFWPLVAISALCAGVDAFITKKRVDKYGVLVEVNPLVRQIMEDYGKESGIILNSAINAAIISLLCIYQQHTLLAIFTGAKLGLLAMQLKSLQVETYIEKVLASARMKMREQGRIQ